MIFCDVLKLEFKDQRGKVRDLEDGEEKRRYLEKFNLLTFFDHINKFSLFSLRKSIKVISDGCIVCSRVGTKYRRLDLV